MPPKKDENQNEKESKQDKKKVKKKVLAKGEGMGGTIGYMDKPAKKCLTPAKEKVSCKVPICCPTSAPCCTSPMQCIPIIYCPLNQCCQWQC